MSIYDKYPDPWGEEWNDTDDWIERAFENDWQSGNQETVVFPGEKHMRVLRGKNIGTPYQFAGPGTNITRRLNAGMLGINGIDAGARIHDLEYYKMMKRQQAGEVVTQAEVRASDQKLLDAVRKYKSDDPATAYMMILGFQSKFKLEDLGVMPYMKFVKDPNLSMSDEMLKLQGQDFKGRAKLAIQGIHKLYMDPPNADWGGVAKSWWTNSVSDVLRSSDTKATLKRKAVELLAKKGFKSAADGLSVTGNAYGFDPTMTWQIQELLMNSMRKHAMSALPEGAQLRGAELIEKINAYVPTNQDAKDVVSIIQESITGTLKQGMQNLSQKAVDAANIARSRITNKFRNMGKSTTQTDGSFTEEFMNEFVSVSSPNRQWETAGYRHSDGVDWNAETKGYDVTYTAEDPDVGAFEMEDFDAVYNGFFNPDDVPPPKELRSFDLDQYTVPKVDPVETSVPVEMPDPVPDFEPYPIDDLPMAVNGLAEMVEGESAYITALRSAGSAISRGTEAFGPASFLFQIAAEGYSRGAELDAEEKGIKARLLTLWDERDAEIKKWGKASPATLGSIKEEEAKLTDVRSGTRALIESAKGAGNIASIGLFGVTEQYDNIEKWRAHHKEVVKQRLVEAYAEKVMYEDRDMKPPPEFTARLNADLAYLRDKVYDDEAESKQHDVWYNWSTFTAYDHLNDEQDVGVMDEQFVADAQYHFPSFWRTLDIDSIAHTGSRLSREEALTAFKLRYGDKDLNEKLSDHAKWSVNKIKEMALSAADVKGLHSEYLSRQHLEVKQAIQDKLKSVYSNTPDVQGGHVVDWDPNRPSITADHKPPATSRSAATQRGHVVDWGSHPSVSADDKRPGTPRPKPKRKRVEETAGSRRVGYGSQINNPHTNYNTIHNKRQAKPTAAPTAPAQTKPKLVQPRTVAPPAPVAAGTPTTM